MEEKTQIIESSEEQKSPSNSNEVGLQAIKAISLFDKLEEHEKEELFKLGSFLTFQPHSNIVIEGEKSRGLYIVINGTLSVYKNDKATNSMIRLAYLESGNIFGELSLFDDIPRSATITTETDCQIFNLDQSKFEAYLKEKGENLQVRFYKRCAEEIAERFRIQNDDYIVSQNLLWKYGLRRKEEGEEESKEE